ncbi:MAG: hypothetical protein JO277_03495, partial [Candidatus Eremiobacteraeota bacterium]|nr:hypothetical protein [Candidatus Eremiobacteraeota bacterium]
TGTFFYPTLTYQQAAEAYDIVTGPDGNLWFTDNINDQIVRVSPAIANMSVMHQRRDADRKL